jgi:thioesterase domain-containing protein
MEAGVDSLGAVELRNQLQRAAVGEGVALSSTVVFDHPTARALAKFFSFTAHASVLNDDVNNAVRMASSLTAPLPSVLQSVAAAQSTRASTIGLDDTFTSSGLMCLRPADSGVLLVCVPAGSGHADGYRPFARVVDNPIYAAIHPHLQTGSHLDLHASKLEEIADAWAIAILQECGRLLRPGFSLMGASLGGVLAHQTALAAQSRGHSPRVQFLLDPLPPIRPYSVTHSTSFTRRPHDAVGYLSGIAADEGFELPAQTAEADMGVLLAERAAELGRAPFTPAAALERQREVRVCTQLLGLNALFCMEQESHPEAHRDSQVCLVVQASEKTSS